MKDHTIKVSSLSTKICAKLKLRIVAHAYMLTQLARRRGFSVLSSYSWFRCGGARVWATAFLLYAEYLPWLTQ